VYTAYTKIQHNFIQTLMNHKMLRQTKVSMLHNQRESQLHNKLDTSHKCHKLIKQNTIQYNSASVSLHTRLVLWRFISSFLT